MLSVTAASSRLSFQILQTFDLLFTNSRIIDFKNIDRSFFFQTIFVHTHDCLFTTSRYEPAYGQQLLRYASSEVPVSIAFAIPPSFSISWIMIPSLMSQFVRQRFYIVRTSPRVDVPCRCKFLPEYKSEYYERYVQRNLLAER